MSQRDDAARLKAETERVILDTVERVVLYVREDISAGRLAELLGINSADLGELQSALCARDERARAQSE